MSGSLSGEKTPSDVAADENFQKGSGNVELLRMMTSLPQLERMAQQPVAAPSPVWIARYQRNAAGEGYATIECPECLGTFAHVLIGTIDPVSNTDCLFCGSLVRYEIFQADDLLFLLPFHHERFARTPSIARSTNTRYEARLRKTKRVKRANTQMNRAL
jgi:hypothetical protein